MAELPDYMKIIDTEMKNGEMLLTIEVNKNHPIFRRIVQQMKFRILLTWIFKMAFLFSFWILKQIFREFKYA